MTQSSWKISNSCSELRFPLQFISQCRKLIMSLCVRYYEFLDITEKMSINPILCVLICTWNCYSYVVHAYIYILPIYICLFCFFCVFCFHYFTFVFNLQKKPTAQNLCHTCETNTIIPTRIHSNKPIKKYTKKDPVIYRTVKMTTMMTVHCSVFVIKCKYILKPRKTKPLLIIIIIIILVLVNNSFNLVSSSSRICM